MSGDLTPGLTEGGGWARQGEVWADCGPQDDTRTLEDLCKYLAFSTVLRVPKYVKSNMFL